MRTMSGASLIELIIATAIMGILLSLAIPSYRIYIDNIRVRSTAEVAYSALQKARSEAVARNTAVDFVLTNNPTLGIIDLANADPATGPLATGSNWIIQQRPANDPSDFIEGKLGAEGAGGAAGSAMPTQISGAVAFVTFNALGGTTLAANATFQVTSTSNACAANGGPIRCLNVVVSRGGQVRLCDPAATAAGDTRGC